MDEACDDVEGKRVIGSECADSSTPGVLAFAEIAGEASLEREVLVKARPTVLFSSATRPRLASLEAVLLARAGRSPSVETMAVIEDLRVAPLSCSDPPIKCQEQFVGAPITSGICCSYTGEVSCVCASNCSGQLAPPGTT